MAIAIARIITASWFGFRPPRNIRGAAFVYRTILSFLRQECLGLADFLPLGIGVFCELHELAEIFGRLLAVACTVGGAGGAPVCAKAVWSVLERGLVLPQGSRGLSRFKQQIRQQFAQRIEPILHRYVLETAVFS